MSEKAIESIEPEKRGYSPTEFAKMFGIGRSTVFDQIYSGKLNAYKLGARTIIPANSVDEWEKNLQKKSKCSV